MIRYSILHFFLLLIFILLIAGPLVASKFIKSLPSIPMQLIQPTGLNNNDTKGTSQTGTAVESNGAAATSGGSSSTGGAKLMFARAY